ncbi:serine/threonine-protein kinase [Paraliomyxa miuraensis]|uniref:serine/threonine-protein kinase n=1 Tax=Paraliomyxa miuraensis TaxID=376150 RepID=UPI00225B40A0|nr:serine/threonine-protein kinase [Paraliomyxa miuraensis]MCX4239668.1 serine/threonine-protein kinase [Paraliomyxa miuraensis]
MSSSAITSPTSQSPEPLAELLGSAATWVDDELPSARRSEQVLPRGESVGRYVILERVGSGGMGVVYAAYDRDLDRRVAIKLLHAHHGPDPETKESKGQARLLREAQAMAKLAHPNVVAVHEVGTFQHRTFVAMEFVDGPTFKQWRKQARRSWREVVEVLVQAGKGLAAAHEQGLVHRDFKPENMLLGRDGRVRVLDFGLARSMSEGSERLQLPLEPEWLPRDSTSIRLTATGALTGTPAYMAPEQYRGQATDARTDQFAFCVTLWEALYDERPFRGDNRAQLAMAVCKGELREPPPRDVPAFLRRALRRGLSLRPDERFESMEALLAAIDRDPGRTRRRMLAAGLGTLAIATLSGATAWWSGGGSEDPCGGGRQRLATAWGDARREAVAAAFGAVEAEFAATSQQTVEHELDAYTTRWIEGHRDACEATHVRHEQSSELLDRRMACLDRRRLALDATTELLAAGDRDVIARSVGAVMALPSLDECARPEALMAAYSPPEPSMEAEVETLRGRLARANALGLTGRAEVGLAEARAVVARAAELDYAPLRAEAALTMGQVAANVGHEEEALEQLYTAVDEAVAAGHDEVLVRATTDLISFVGVNLSRYDEAERWGRLAGAAVRRRGRDMNDTIDLDQSLCFMRSDKGDPTGAMPLCQEALELSIVRHGPEHASTGVAHRALGNAHYAAGQLEAAEHDYQRATELFLASHGLDHPEYPNLLNALAAVCYSQGRGEPCVAKFEEALQASIRAHGPDHPAVADLTNNLAVVLMDQGRLDQAEAHAKRSLELRRARSGDDHPGVGAALRVLASIAEGRGDLRMAAEHADQALAQLRRTRGEQHPDVLDVLGLRAGIELAAGRVDDGVRDLEDALAMAEALERPALERAARRFALAKALAEHRPDDRARALELATAAEAEAKAADPNAPVVQEIATWRVGLDGTAAVAPSR